MIHWLKADVTSDTVGVDREAQVLRGYVVAQEGPFKTPGRGEFDARGLKAIVKLMRASPAGLKSRFTHPTLSDDGLGKFLGRARSPRLDTVKVRRDTELVELQAVRADLHLDPSSFHTPAGDLGGYVLDLAESDPGALSSSLVLEIQEEFRLAKDGTRKRDEQGRDLPPLWRPVRLHASDVVDTGDAVDGILGARLSVADLPDAALRQGTELLDRIFAGEGRDLVESRCRAWLRRYLEYRFGACLDAQAGPAPARPSRRLRLKARLT